MSDLATLEIGIIGFKFQKLIPSWKTSVRTVMSTVYYHCLTVMALDFLISNQIITTKYLHTKNQ